MDIYIDWALQPLTLIVIMLLLTGVSWCIAGPKPLVPFVLFCISTVMLLTLSMPELANKIVYKVENARQNPDFCSQEELLPVVVLGGGLDFSIDGGNAYEILNSDSLIRVLQAEESVPANSHYYLMGGGEGTRTLAKHMKTVLLNLGVDAANISLDTESFSTHENAQALTTLLPPTTSPTILLVTSWLHIKRASATFEKAGYQVCHLGVDAQFAQGAPPVSWMPYLGALTKMTLALHELLALVVYQIKGYI